MCATNGSPETHTYVPPAATSLPPNIDKTYQPANVAGAKQTASYSAANRGYLGPCPQGVEHTYEFALHTVDVAALPGADITTTRAQAVTLITQHKLGVATLTGKSDASP